MNQRRVTIQMDEDDYEVVRLKADRERRSVASVLRELVARARRSGFLEPTTEESTMTNLLLPLLALSIDMSPDSTAPGSGDLLQLGGWVMWTALAILVIVGFVGAVRWAVGRAGSNSTHIGQGRSGVGAVIGAAVLIGLMTALVVFAFNWGDDVAIDATSAQAPAVTHIA